MLEEFPPGPRARAGLQRRLAGAAGRRGRRGLAWGARAIELAERLGETEAARARPDQDRQRPSCWPAARGAREARAQPRACRGRPGSRSAWRGAYLNIVRSATRTRGARARQRVARSRDSRTAASAASTSTGATCWPTARAIELDQGRWREAARDRRARPAASPAPRCSLRIHRARRPRARAARAAAIPTSGRCSTRHCALADATEPAPGLAPVAAARAEAAWLDGRHGAVARGDRRRARARAATRRSPWLIGELGVLAPARRASRRAIRGGVGGAVGRAARGRGERPRRLWTGSAARTTRRSRWSTPTTTAALRRALDELQAPRRRAGGGDRRRGACASAACAALPRGPRRATQRNPAGLTSARARGARARRGGAAQRRDRATALPREKTAGHHVSAILRKLAVRNRAEAAAAAGGLGLAGPAAEGRLADHRAPRLTQHAQTPRPDRARSMIASSASRGGAAGTDGLALSSTKIRSILSCRSASSSAGGAIQQSEPADGSPQDEVVEGCGGKRRGEREQGIAAVAVGDIQRPPRHARTRAASVCTAKS